MSAPLRVTLLWHAGMVPGYRSFFQRLAALPGLEVSLITPPAWEVSGQVYTAPEAPPVGLRWVRLKPWFTGRVSTLVYPGLSAALDMLRPQVLHLKQEPNHLVCLQAARWLRRSPGTALVFETLQNQDLRYRWPWPWVEQRVFDASRAAVAVTDEIKAVLQGFGYGKPVAVLPLWVEDRLFSPGPQGPARRALGLDPKAYVVGFCGRLAREKGLFELLEALARLSGPWQALWVGDGPDKAALLERARALGIAGRIVLAGALPQERLVQAYRAMDVLALPSLSTPAWKEQFGRALVEAMACGIPCVGSDSGAIPEVIGRGGLVVREGSAAALGSALGRLASKARRRALAPAARRQAARYSSAAVARAHRDLYLSL